MMTILHYVMVYSGVVLMVYNIYRYVVFARRLRSQGGWDQEQRLLRIPIVLLAMFLVGYLAVGIFGQVDLVVSAILCGGSIFVLLMIIFIERVASRIKENERLAGDLMAAKESSRAKSNFLSTMSHEIRTPLNAIIGLNAMVAKEPGLSDEGRDRVAKIGASANHLLTLINEVLDMSRIESGNAELNNERFATKEVFDAVNGIIGSQCTTKGLEYRCEVADSMEAYYVGDAGKIKQVLINVLGNAVKFTEPGGTVSLSAEQIVEFDDMRTVRFIVSDTGIGMDKDYLPKLFDVFTQENASRTNRYGGTGLGMAITKSLVEMMNGEIQVESEKGVGTTFTIKMTLGKCTSYDDLEPNDEEAGGGDAFKGDLSEALSGMRVLMAEDVDLNAEILIDLLDLEGVVAERAENGQIAVDMFAASAEGYYDAVLMDVRMPVLDGLGATAAIRKLDRPDAKTVPIIALTANAFDEDVQRSLQAGMNAHLAKPIDPDQLYEALAKFSRNS